MSFYVRDETTDAAVRKLARMTGLSLTDTIRRAVEAELERQRKVVPLAERLKPLVARYQAYPPSGEEADKAFFDALSGEE
ncbi:type II toxin-antitoxin system VapB family antitoxin [uncultured Devosia sp.]|uniref:type II toxin-antitoxin system VapB family antitoxin n=1 Tax=uncultured Devosia sp. TaxID=211434 RepID=UPI0026142D36|nr:type II toxin-antitoxin system VapB family antitoxin [uncultured Devosia sp.]